MGRKRTVLPSRQAKEVVRAAISLTGSNVRLVLFAAVLERPTFMASSEGTESIFICRLFPSTDPGRKFANVVFSVMEKASPYLLNAH